MKTWAVILFVAALAVAVVAEDAVEASLPGQQRLRALKFLGGRAAQPEKVVVAGAIDPALKYEAFKDKNTGEIFLKEAEEEEEEKRAVLLAEGFGDIIGTLVKLSARIAEAVLGGS